MEYKSVKGSGKGVKKLSDTKSVIQGKPKTYSGKTGYPKNTTSRVDKVSNIKRKA
jgi:hypothetical protein